MGNTTIAKQICAERLVVLSLVKWLIERNLKHAAKHTQVKHKSDIRKPFFALR